MFHVACKNKHSKRNGNGLRNYFAPDIKSENILPGTVFFAEAERRKLRVDRNERRDPGQLLQSRHIDLKVVSCHVAHGGRKMETKEEGKHAKAKLTLFH